MLQFDFSFSLAVSFRIPKVLKIHNSSGKTKKLFEMQVNAHVTEKAISSIALLPNDEFFPFEIWIVRRCVTIQVEQMLS